MASIIKYTTGSRKMRIKTEDNQIQKVDVFHKDIAVGDVFLGRVENHHDQLGSFIDLGEYKALYQKQELMQGEYDLFRIIKTPKDKHPLVDRTVELVGNWMIYGTKGVYFAKRFDEQKKREWIRENFDQVFIKTEALEASCDDLLKEYELLKDKFHKLQQLKKVDNKPKKVFTPFFSEQDPENKSREYEDQILQYRRGILFFNHAKMIIEKTTMGLVVDIDRFSSKESDFTINQRALELLSSVIKLMNVGGIIIVDLIGAKKHPVDFLKQDPRILYAKCSSNAIVEIIRQKKGMDLFDLSLEELLVEHIQKYATSKKLLIDQQYAAVQNMLHETFILEFGECCDYYRELPE